MNVLQFDTEQEITRIKNFIRNYVRQAEARGVVLWISGGIDSAVVAFLASKAIGKKSVKGLLLFEDQAKDGVDYRDAKKVISQLGIESIEFRFTPLVNAFQGVLRDSHFPFSKITLANIKARTRMVILYAVANQDSFLVIGTGDKSEEKLGYFTKYGDGGVDFMPIAHLYKTQVKEIAKKLGVPRSIIEKPSSPNLWLDHKASDELPLDYPALDKVLSLLFEGKKNELDTSKLSHVPLCKVKEVTRMYHSSKHKREYPAMISERVRYLE